MAEIVHFNRCVDTKQQRDIPGTAIGPVNDQCHILQRLDVIQSQQVECLIAAQFQSSGTVVTGELEWKHSHTDEIGSVDPLE